MKIFIVTFLITFAIQDTALCQQWVLSGELPTSVRYEDIFFIDSMVGWTVSSGGRIFKTTNGGETWINQYQTGNYLRSVEFINDSIGFAGSLDGILLRTTDGG